MPRDVVARPRKLASCDAPSAAPESGHVRLHATCVELSGVGVVLLGGSGAGKSDLALRLIDQGARLVADDQLQVEASEDGLLGRPPASLAGLFEVRGLGILRLPHRPVSRLGLVIELVDAASVERLPKQATYTLLGTDLRYMRLDPREPSADAKVRLAVRAEQVA